MKISSKEEYGLRLLIRIARASEDEVLTINELAQQEEMSTSHAAKILRILRMKNYISSTQGKSGGYYLAIEPEFINIGKLFSDLGGNLYDEKINNQVEIGELCNGSVDCAIKSLFKIVQHSVDRVINKMTLAELLSPEDKFINSVKKKFQVVSEKLIS